MARQVLSIEELDRWISDRIQGGFGRGEMAVMKEEIEKLQPDEIYLEVGVDEGRSLTVARHYAHPDVWTIGVDYIDPPARAPYMNIQLGHFPNGTGMISLGAKTFYIHGDANMVSQLFNPTISLMFIDGDHSYEGVQKDTLAWEPKMKKGGTILFHDYDHPDTRRFLDDYYGDNKEVINDKIVRVRV